MTKDEFDQLKTGDVVEFLSTKLNPTGKTFVIRRTPKAVVFKQEGFRSPTQVTNWLRLRKVNAPDRE